MRSFPLRLGSLGRTNDVLPEIGLNFHRIFVRHKPVGVKFPRHPDEFNNVFQAKLGHLLPAWCRLAPVE